MWKMF